MRRLLNAADGEIGRWLKVDDGRGLGPIDRQAVAKLDARRGWSPRPRRAVEVTDILQPVRGWLGDDAEYRVGCGRNHGAGRNPTPLRSIPEARVLLTVRRRFVDAADLASLGRWQEIDRDAIALKPDARIDERRQPPAAAPADEAQCEQVSVIDGLEGVGSTSCAGTRPPDFPVAGGTLLTHRLSPVGLFTRTHSVHAIA